MRSIKPTWADLGRKHGMGVIEDYLKKKGLI
jgi:hypothetical protein